MKVLLLPDRQNARPNSENNLCKTPSAERENLPRTRIHLHTLQNPEPPSCSPPRSSEMLTALFAQPILASYKRVNKVGNKNLRCFPGHSPTGHCESGFCGQPVILHVPGASLSAATYVAEFTLKDSPLNTKAKFAPVEDCFPGQRLGDTIVFNRDCHGWRYSWVSTRHTAGQLHVLRVNVILDGFVVGAVDSSPFTVSSLRNQVVSEALGAVSPSDPLRLVLMAIHERVHDDCNDLDFGDFADDWEGSSGGFFDDATLMDVENEDKLLAIERVDALLARMSSFILQNFNTWRSMHAMKVDLDNHLLQCEGRSIHAVADELCDLFGMRLDCQPAVVPMGNTEVLFKSAFAAAQGMLPSGSAICPEFVLGGPNDVSGHYRVPESFLTFSHDVRLKAGWSALEMNISRNYSDLRILTKVLSPLDISMCAPGKAGLHKSILLKLCVLRGLSCARACKCSRQAPCRNEANRPPDCRPLQFAADHSRIVFAWAHSTGFVKVTMMRPNFRMLQSISKRSGLSRTLETHWETQHLVNAATDEWATDSSIDAVLQDIDEVA
jgi:hypothetical protein